MSSERYDYRDADGQHVFSVVRGPGKTFRMQAADGTPRRPREGKGLPFRLPEVIAAAAAGKAIAIVEGEKDVLALARIGVTATCNAGGAGKWTSKHARQLPERTRVVVMGDADLPGVDHMLKVATTCERAGHIVLIIPPEALGFEIQQDHGKDVADWLEDLDRHEPGDAGKGSGKREIEDLAKEALTLAQWQAASRPADGSIGLGRDELDRGFGSVARLILLRRHDEILLADDGNYGTCLTLDERGIWQSGGRRWVAWFSELSRELAEVVDRGDLDDKTAREVQRALRHPNGVENVRRQIGGVLDDMRQQGEAPQVTECASRDLDAQTQYLGAANGVVDLWTGQRLPPEEARQALVTQSAPTAFDPDATQPDVEQLFAHLPEETCRWWWVVLGYCLLGSPSRRVYLIVGPPSGGKTTLINALANTLGPYADRPADDALEGKAGVNAGLSPELEAFVAPRRYALIDEAPSLRVSTTKLKRLSGDGQVTFRRLHQQLQTRPATATIFIVCNPNSVPRFRLQDSAMADRLRELPYPKVLNPDLGFRDRITEKDFRQALLARLVKEASSQTPGRPPDNVEQVRKATLARVEEDKGELGIFAKRLRPGVGYLTVRQVWDAWCEHNGSSDEEKKVGGLGIQSLSRALREYVPGLPAPGSVRPSGGNPVKGWKDWRME